MISMKYQKYIAVSLILLSCGLKSMACGPYYYTPSEYYMYRISERYMTGQTYNTAFNYGSEENCLLWQEQTSKDIPVEDIYKVVYKANDQWIANLLNHQGADGPTYSFGRNLFADWLWDDSEAAAFLLLAKECEDIRRQMTDPWYYPSKRDPQKKGLEEIVLKAEAYDGKRFSARYVLQAERALFSLRRYDDCINYWNGKKARVPDNILRRLILRYVAGAYYNIGDIEKAMMIYGEVDDISSLLFCAQKAGKKNLEALYDYSPESQALRAEVERIIIHAESILFDSDSFGRTSYDFETLKYVRDLSMKIAEEGKVSDPDLWYYTAAFVEHLLEHDNEALRLVRKAEKSRGSDFIKESIHVLKLYLIARGPYDGSYEKEMFNGVKWLEGKIVAHLDEGREETIRHGMYYTRINFSYFYWNDMLRKIVHAGIAPKLCGMGKESTALAFSNMADNLIFNLVGEVDAGWNSPRRVSIDKYRTEGVFNSLDYCNHTFYLLDKVRIESIIQYVKSLEHPGNEMQSYLNAKGNINKNYFYEIIGTRLLRDMRYSEAEAWFAKVPSSFQAQLNTFKEGYFRYDPFVPEKTRIADNADYKYNFAREMVSLESAISGAVDPDRKAILLTKFATGIKNSLGNCWALSFYGLSWGDTYTEEGPTVFSAAQDMGFARAEKLYAEALKICRDKETAAQINLFLGNRKTVVEEYNQTQTANYVRGHCDTYSDYHFETKSRFWDSIQNSDRGI